MGYVLTMLPCYMLGYMLWTLCFKYQFLRVNSSEKLYCRRFEKECHAYQSHCQTSDATHLLGAYPTKMWSQRIMLKKEL